MDRIEKQIIIKNAHVLDFFRTIVGIIALVIMFIFLGVWQRDGYLITLTITYVAFLSGLGWGLYFNRGIMTFVKQRWFM